MKLILASSSPRRAEVLRDAGIAFEVRAAQVEEAQRSGESGRTMVARLAEAKARAVALQVDGSKQDSIVIGANTSVELDGEIFGKPRDATNAIEMLTSLSGRTHHVLTGIFLLRLPDGVARSAVESTSVTFAPLHREEIETYVASGEPLDKAPRLRNSRPCGKVHSMHRWLLFQCGGVAAGAASRFALRTWLAGQSTRAK
jgi:septum formation protein